MKWVSTLKGLEGREFFFLQVNEWSKREASPDVKSTLCAFWSGIGLLEVMLK